MRFVETHINGALGRSFSMATPDEIVRIRQHLFRKHRLEGLLASLVSLPEKNILRGIAALKESEHGPGAKLLGIHLEGPFLNPIRRGAHRKENLRRPSVREFARYAQAADGRLKMITLAPELPGAAAVMREASRSGILISIGHSDATYDEARRAFDAGAVHVTHLYNAMSGFHHRAAGLVGAALLSGAYVEIIYDRVHVAPEAAAIALRCVDRKKIILASDASPALDAPDGRYAFDGISTVIRGGRCVTARGGRLAGSMSGLWTCYRNFCEDFGPFPEAVSENPLRLLRLAQARK